MAKTGFPVEISPDVLRWARESAGRSVDDAAQKLRKSARAITEWEAGQKQPSWQDVRRLAAYYRRPVAALLLPQPPTEPDQPTDFRTHPGTRRKLSPKTLLAIRTARWLQARGIELREELGAAVEFHAPRR